MCVCVCVCVFYMMYFDPYDLYLHFQFGEFCFRKGESMF